MTRFWRRLVRLGFHLLYNELAWTYDLVSWVASLGEWRAWQKAALPYVCGRRVLEIAHGPGHMLLALEVAGYQALGLDLSSDMSRLAQRRLRRARVHVPLLRAKIPELPLAAGCFDSVLATFPNDFIVETATLSNLFRVLRPAAGLSLCPRDT